MRKAHPPPKYQILGRAQVLIRAHHGTLVCNSIHKFNTRLKYPGTSTQGAPVPGTMFGEFKVGEFQKNWGIWGIVESFGV